MAQTSVSETRPPWIVYPGEPPFSGQFRQGNGEFYLQYVWLPFWRGLGAIQQEEYFRQWSAPPDWREYYRQGGTLQQEEADEE